MRDIRYFCQYCISQILYSSLSWRLWDSKVPMVDCKSHSNRIQTSIKELILSLVNITTWSFLAVHSSSDTWSKSYADWISTFLSGHWLSSCHPGSLTSKAAGFDLGRGETVESGCAPMVPTQSMQDECNKQESTHGLFRVTQKHPLLPRSAGDPAWVWGCFEKMELT